MKNFLITPFLFKNKYKKIVFGLNYEWYEFAEKNKINLIIVNNKKELKNIFKIKIHGLILSGGNDLSNIKRNKLIYYVKKRNRNCQIFYQKKVTNYWYLQRFSIICKDVWF